jgi:hypothetical protein
VVSEHDLPIACVVDEDLHSREQIVYQVRRRLGGGVSWFKCLLNFDSCLRGGEGFTLMQPGVPLSTDGSAFRCSGVLRGG